MEYGKVRKQMRVISGTAKRMQLKTVEGLETRPTQDRIKETLFNMIQHDLYDSVFLDLFSGSGGIGIEALSRGARKAYFVENSSQAMNCIRENLKHTQLETRAECMQVDVMSALQKLQGREKVDYIFMDPPYNQLLEKQVLEQVATMDLLSEDGIIIVEASQDTQFDYVEALGFEILKIKKYKTNQHLFLGKI